MAHVNKNKTRPNPTHNEFTDLIQKYYPRNWKHWQENDIFFDHTPHTKLGKKIINKLALTVTPAYGVGEWAKKNGCDAVLAHHPYGSTDPIPVYAAHTRADRGLVNFGNGEKIGINQLWAKYLGLKNIRQVDDLYSFGEFEKAITFEEADKKVSRIIQHVANKLGDKLDYKTCSGQKLDGGKLIKKVNICSGMGGLVIGKTNSYNFVSNNYYADKEKWDNDYADLYVTGEIGFEATHSNQNFENILETFHTHNERIILVAWKSILGALYPNLEIVSVPLGIDNWNGDVSYNE